MSIFSNISARRPQSSDFNLSHTRKFAFSPGRCTPSLCQEVLPSDKWNYNMSALVRMMPMQAPVMHMVDVYNYSFFVPARLTMERSKFETFITGGKNGDGKDALGNTIEIPYFNINFTEPPANSGTSLSYENIMSSAASGVWNRRLADFLGIGISDGLEFGGALRKINAMPFIAFWKIWNQYFRDQNLHPDYEELYPGIFEATGNITAAIHTAVFTNAANPLLFMDFFNLPRVCWEKDYFTSALPFAQRGNPVETPLSGTGSVTYMPQSEVYDTGTGLLAGDGIVQSDNGALEWGPAPPAGAAGRIENIDEVNLESGGFTINALRLAARLQEWLEKMARGGARYIEQIRSHFGVVSSDARLQRPEFLGGGKIPVSISEVLQTSDDGGTPLATMAGHGVSAGSINSFSRFFEEHGFLISVIFMRPRTAYQEGIPRLFTKRFDKLDWAWPSFAHLGEQEISQSELFFTGAAAADDTTFGYQARYAEYKYIPSTVHGEFKTTLNFWHWGRIFGSSAPSLSPEFVNCDPSTRIFNVIDENDNSLYCIVNNRIKARRPLPYFSSPTL